ncbi:PQ-loop domain-containing transporter [[Mycoplasma] gypis]|uniref:PQ-loop domain-containing transporter n=1 Tax=[Mycoplasma] gypis TaxID=92404 RepID=A0ABZ2RRS7_9BACT|nr:PQ-loop domain-containing transporter [[Mycoplasma] gypis]MBN0919521.1 hypothetical protein [[Mycoplasma] gypis]
MPNQNFITAGTVFGWFAVVVTICLGIPQLVKLLKDKKTGEISYVSFWIFYLGLFAWVLFGSFLPGSLAQVSVANLISIIIYSFTMFFIYFYEQKRKWKMSRKNTLITVSIILIIFCLLSLACTALGIADKDNIYKIHNSAAATVLGAIVPMLTTFAFMPQIILSFKTKNFGGVSAYMILLFLLNNAFWIIYWASRIHMNIVEGQTIIPLIIATIWQITSSIIYGILFFFTIRYEIKIKKSKMELA